MAADHGRVWAGLAVAMALVASASVAAGQDAAVSAAPQPHPAAKSAKPAAAEAPAMTAAESAMLASEDAQYHDELMAAAASLKADIKAESDASAAEITDAQSGPTGTGLIVAGGVVVFALLVSIFIIPASLRARKRRREMLAEMLAGKPPHKR